MLLRVRDLTTTFKTDRGVVRAVDGVSFDVPEAATVGMVGESGCGKSVTSLSILRLIQEPPGHIDRGSIEFEGRDLLKLTEREMQDVRGNRVSMIFQEPMTSLNPVYSVGSQIVEAIRLHRSDSRRQAWDRAVEMLKKVGIPAPASVAKAYPHELSGGMRQRVMIAMALSCDPKLLIADEPTTALDVTIQAQILELVKSLQAELKMSVLLITHDLGIIAEYTQYVLVMYAGKIVEAAPARAIFAKPKHPYTRALLESLPRPGARAKEAREASAKSGEKRARLPMIPGMVPDLRNLPPGCRFCDRCPLVIEKCTQLEPELIPIGDESENHASRCWRADEV